MNQPTFIDIEKAAVILGLPVQTARRHMKRLRAHKFGERGVLKWRRSAVVQLKHGRPV